MTSPSVKLLRTQTDERLVALAAAGHERAFEAIVERYRRPLLRHCRRYLPEARAEDALQQALVSAWGALRRGDEVRALRPWLHRIVHNTSLNALRAAG
jgi:RNA polymerase sigma factor (sigma-70 family)